MTISGGGSRDPVQRLLEAIQSGIRGEELQAVLEAELPKIRESLSTDEWLNFRSELSADPEINEALVAAQLGEAKTGVAPILGGGGPEVISKTTAAGETIVTEAGKAYARKLSDPNLFTKVMQFIGRHKKGAALTLGGGGLAFAASNPDLFSGEGGQQGQAPLLDPSSWLRPPEEEPTGPRIAQPGTQVDYGYNVYVVDRDGSITGTPGNVVVLQPEDTEAGLGISPDLLNELGQARDSGIADIGGAGAFDAALAQGNIQANLFIDDRVIQTISPKTLGSIKIAAPVQVSASSPIIEAQAPPQTGNAGRNAFERNIAPPQTMETPDTHIPAGAEIAPRSFTEYGGRTLLEWASVAARRNGVPLNVLYGIIDHESGWLPTAVGDNGNSHGLAQIYQPVWGDQVSRSQALNPAYALEWTAKKLRERFDQYGRWDAAIAAHNSPAAADYLARTGRFQNQKSANYVASVMSKSNVSGLDNVIFGDEVANIPIDGTGGGATYSPYQSPDPAASKEFIEATYQELLGRSPTDQEMAKEITRIETLARQSYGANLTQAKGGESQAVDVEAQFRRGIKDTGEFAFNESTHQLDSFTDFTAGVARLLQQGL
jgi:soluble lytic murein transglycosylase-like protein